MNKQLQFLRDICEAIGPSGYEQDVAKLWKDYVESFSNVDVDVHGNVIASLNNSAKFKIMLAGHIDEIGFMIRYIDKDGFLYFSPIGGVDPHLVIGQRVKIKTEHGVLYGVVGRKPIHLMDKEEMSKSIKWQDLFIDIGAKNREQAQELVMIGDVAVPWVNFFELKGNKFASKALDDRAGAYVVARTLELLAERKDQLKVAVFSVATVQEEIGLRGAKTSAYGINPSIGIAVDVTFATDYPLMDEKKIGSIKLGEGPVIARGPNINPRLFEKLRYVASNCDIKYQLEAIPRATGTDANSIQITRAGVCTGLVSIPLRYMHTPVEVVCFDDLETAACLLSEFILRLTGTEQWELY